MIISSVNNYNFLTFFVFIFNSFAALPLTAEPVNISEVKVLVCPQGCGPLVPDQYMSKLIEKENNNFKYTPVITKGYLDNINQFGKDKTLWKTAIFANNDDTLIFAQRGGEHPFKKFIPHKINENFKLLYGFYWGTTGHFFITFNSKIKSISDLKGRKIGLGFYGQSDWSMNPTLDLEYGYNITAENTELKYLGPKILAKAIHSGEIDATVAALGVGVKSKRWLQSGIFSSIKKSKNIYYIGHKPEMVNLLNKKLGTAYIPITIPKGTLPRQHEDIETFADRDYKVAHHTFPKDLAYKIVKYAAKYGPRMMLSANIWQTWSPEIMVAGLTEKNTHPGAIRAFKELGWWKLRKNYPPVEFKNK